MAVAGLLAVPNRTDAGPAIPKLSAATDPARLRRVAEEFEAVFIAQMLQPMMSGLSAEPPFGGGFAEDMWRETMVQEYGKAIAKAGGIGLADAVVREVERMHAAAGGAGARKVSR